LPVLREKARHRKPGYLEACLALGEADENTGTLRISPENWVKIRGQFSYSPEEKAARMAERIARRTGSPITIRGPAARQKRGLGDIIHGVAGPVGKALHWPCLEGDGTTDLKPGSPCDKARQALNHIKIRGVLALCIGIM
jgi:hypothetical protein